ncbi:hypothetical protein KKF59_01165 [Patescibacteria group bacterium]|nr:hypothetical protein [Patescibacteria group bacterium]
MIRRPAGLPVQKKGLDPISLLVAVGIAACGGAGADEGDGSGNGGSGNSGLTGTGNQGNGNSGTGAGGSSSSGTGGGEVCHPTLENGWCADAPSCECEVTSWYPNMPCPGLDENGDKIPDAIGNVCFPGHNQCGCDLPLGEDYQAPDAECIQYIGGDTWVKVGEPDIKGPIGSSYKENGQLRMAGLGPSYIDYYDGCVVSARKIVWNQTNRDQYDFAEGEFSPDCKTITMNYFHAGEAEPFETVQVVWLHHPGA